VAVVEVVESVPTPSGSMDHETALLALKSTCWVGAREAVVGVMLVVVIDVEVTPVIVGLTHI
jgi:hypothetical protein